MLSPFKTKYKAILFDMDGTIIFSDTAYWKAIQETIGEHSIKLGQSEQESLHKKVTGLGLANIASVLAKELNLSTPPSELAEKIIKPVHRHLPKNTKLIPGFEQFHKTIRENGIPSAIATNSDRVSFGLLIKRFEFDKIFGQHLYCAQDVSGKLKPDPAIFLHGAAKVNVDPKECIVFEDSLVGLVAAKSAGMKCVLVKNHKNSDILHMADSVLENYDQAVEVINNL